MRIAVLGAGGIGGYYGGRLAKAGHDVVLLARGAHLEALQRRGLTLRTPEGELTLPIAATADGRGLAPVDLVLFCVKAFDTEAGARTIAPLVGSDTTVLTVQNGLDRAGALAAALGGGAGAVLGAAVYAALQLAGPGIVARTGAEARITFGERGGAPSRRTERLAAALREAGLPHEVSPDIDRVLWEKFLFITGIGAVTALARAGIGALRESAEGRALLAASCGEIVAVAQAEGAPLRPEAAAAALAQSSTLPGPWRSSLARDLEEGRPLEVEALSGAVVARGRRAGVPTPVHQTIAACLSLGRPAPASNFAVNRPARQEETP
ncbi:MAG TPA: 2-dehydropantoate 2-reductase [Candidatus Nitrosotalea sp.]|nr:2-dehydropantoate 2-reductase [Candidatus Nitrosotalea sp.]